METGRPGFELDVATGATCPLNNEVILCEKPRGAIEDSVRFAAGKLIGVPSQVEDGWLVPEYMRAHCSECGYGVQARIELGDNEQLGERIQVVFTPGL